MSGWLPFEAELADLLKIDEGDHGELDTEGDDDDPFAHEIGDDDIPAHIKAINHIRDILGIPPFLSDADTSINVLPVSDLKTPVFLGHGAAGPKVSVDLGRWMTSVLSGGFGMDVTWKVYEEFGHWYKLPDEIDDVVRTILEGESWVRRC